MLSGNELAAYNRRLLFIAENVKNDDEGDGDAISVTNSIICSNDKCGKEFSFDAANITVAPVGDWFCPICVGRNAAYTLSSSTVPSVVDNDTASSIAVSTGEMRPRRAATYRVSYMGDSLVPECNSKSK